jgi:predicted transposase YdaD
MGANVKYKDSLFSFLFNDPDTLRELYGAIAGVELPADIPVTINTLEDVLYKTLLNDISFELDRKLVILLEHQSTINPNMAVRLLMYIARVYEKITAGRNVYGSKKLRIPRPEFIVLYNGVAPYPDEAVLRLSDAFETAGGLGLPAAGGPNLELIVRVYNINPGHNDGMARRCERLAGYRAFIGKARELEDGGLSREKAVEGAVQWCVGEGILRQFFETHGSEVMNMLMTEWKLEDALVVEREEGWEEGREEGLAEGWGKGLAEGWGKGREEGWVKGREEEKAGMAGKLKTMGMPPEQIAAVTGLSPADIAAL